MAQDAPLSEAAVELSGAPHTTAACSIPARLAHRRGRRWRGCCLMAGRSALDPAAGCLSRNLLWPDPESGLDARHARAAAHYLSRCLSGARRGRTEQHDGAAGAGMKQAETVAMSGILDAADVGWVSRFRRCKATSCMVCCMWPAVSANEWLRLS